MSAPDKSQSLFKTRRLSLLRYPDDVDDWCVDDSVIADEFARQIHEAMTAGRVTPAVGVMALESVLDELYTARAESSLSWLQDQGYPQVQAFTTRGDD